QLPLTDDRPLNLVAGCVGRRLVPAAVLPELDMIARRPLSELDGFADADDLERNGRRRGHFQARRSLTTRGRPVRTDVVIDDFGSVETGILPRRVGRNGLSTHEVG